jgi:hypothetical protein
MELTDPLLIRELKWRGLLNFIDYDFEDSQPWKEYLESRDKDDQEDLDITKRKFYTEFIDKSFDIKSVLNDQDRQAFL